MVISINDKIVDIKSQSTILQSCKKVGIEVPRFCYHERLMIAGNCRMCIVEVEKSLKPVASCAMNVVGGMKVYTNTNMVKKCQEGVMEMLLSNHPLDCPICDQGGECDLQDQSLVYGTDRGRFYDFKRSVVDKNCSVLIKTIMTRCIHCTRCVRFIQDVAGLSNFGVTGRGNAMEIGTYVSSLINSEVSGNVIDLCPVGALTSKPFSYLSRSWELNVVESVDIFDSLGSNLNLMLKEGKIIKILPCVNEDINEEWITDKVRFSYDGYRRQRILNPMVNYKGEFLTTVSWEVALSYLFAKLYGNCYSIKGYVGNSYDLVQVYMFKSFINTLGYNGVNSVLGGKNVNLDFFSNYGFNISMKELVNKDYFIFIGGNVRFENPLLLIKLRRIQQLKNAKVSLIGVTINYFLKVSKFGLGTFKYYQLLDGKSYLSSCLILSKNPILFISNYYMNNVRFTGIKNYIFDKLLLNKVISRTSINYLNLSGGSTGLFDLGVTNLDTSDFVKNMYFVLGTEELGINKKKGDKLVYMGYHGDNVAFSSDIILPITTSIESDGIYANNLGVLQLNNKVITNPGFSRGGVNLINNLLDFFLGKRVYDLISVISRSIPIIFNVKRRNSIVELKTDGLNFSIRLVVNEVYNNIYNSYYRMDSISKNSKVMGVCHKNILINRVNYRWKF